LGAYSAPPDSLVGLMGPTYRPKGQKGREYEEGKGGDGRGRRGREERRLLSRVSFAGVTSWAIAPPSKK